MKSRQAKKIACLWSRGIRLRWRLGTLTNALDKWWYKRFKRDGTEGAW